MPKTDMSFFGLNRPEYVPAPELALAELAWSLAPSELQQRLKESSPKGMAFGSRGNKPSKRILYTKPQESSEAFDELSAELRNRLGLDQNKEAMAAKVLLSEIEVFASQKTTRSTAAPLTLPMALLQDRRGITGKSNPSNIALILEQIFKLGQGSGTAAGHLLNAYCSSSGKGLPEWIDETIPEILPEHNREALEAILANGENYEVAGARNPKWLGGTKTTPFHWFASTWRGLCSDGWIDAMPRRRWTDWATCVTRTGVATSFLFEMHLNYRLVPALVSDTDANDVVAIVNDESSRLIPWDTRKARSAQNVGPIIKRLSESGAACQLVLQKLKSELPDFPAPIDFDEDPNGLINWLQSGRAKIGDAREQVRSYISRHLDENPPASAKNIRETIRYSLLGRGGDQTLDLYSLLKFGGPSTWVDPGQEWLVTVASLCASEPGKATRLVDLNKALSCMGIGAATSTLVEKLEAYGLSRSSHDADDAIEIQPAF